MTARSMNALSATHTPHAGLDRSYREDVLRMHRVRLPH